MAVQTMWVFYIVASGISLTPTGGHTARTLLSSPHLPILIIVDEIILGRIYISSLWPTWEEYTLQIINKVAMWLVFIIHCDWKNDTLRVLSTGLKEHVSDRPAESCYRCYEKVMFQVAPCSENQRFKRDMNWICGLKLSPHMPSPYQLKGDQTASG